MKKLIILAALAGAGFVAYRRWEEAKRENDVWAAATDPVPPRDLR